MTSHSLIEFDWCYFLKTVFLSKRVWREQKAAIHFKEKCLSPPVWVKKSHMGKLDIISFSGLNRCGTGRIEIFFWRMLENVFPRVRSCEKLPASFLHFGFGFFFFFFLRKQWLGSRQNQKFQKLFISQLWNCCRKQTPLFLIMLVGNVTAEVLENWLYQTTQNNLNDRITNS